jgi:hypothetical protein
MQGYSNGTLGHFKTVDIKSYVEAYMQGCSKASVKPFMAAHYFG